MSNVGINPTFSLFISFCLFCSEYWVKYFFIVQGHHLLFLLSNVFHIKEILNIISQQNSLQMNFAVNFYFYNVQAAGTL